MQGRAIGAPGRHRMQRIRVQQYGGPEVMQLEDVSQPTPGSGQALVRVEAIGVNFMDIYVRGGAYKNPLPLTPGNEGAGVVEAMGPDVTDVKVGDRVAWVNVPGSYSAYHVVPVRELAPIPDGVTFDQAASAMMQGITAHYLAVSTYPLGPKDTCLIHAAAGGLGQLLSQIAKMRGARVIGTAGSR